MCSKYLIGIRKVSERNYSYRFLFNKKRFYESGFNCSLSCFIAKYRKLKSIEKRNYFSFNDLLVEYVDYRKYFVKESTWENSGHELIRSLYDIFGLKAVEKITDYDVVIVRDKFKKSNLKRNYVIFNFIKKIFDYGKDLENLNIKCYRFLIPIKNERICVKKHVVYSKDDFKKMIINCKDINELTIIVFLFTTGIRKSEMLGLKWNDIDFDNEVIDIFRNKYCLGISPSGNNDCSLKNTSSIRSIKVNNELIKLLMLKKSNSKSEFVFNGRNNNSLSKSQLKRIVDRITKRCNLPQIDIHEFRHSFASLMFNDEDVDLLEIAKYLGHSNTNVTELTYVHLNSFRHSVIANKIERDLGKAINDESEKMKI